MTVEEAEKAEKSDEALEKYRLAGKILAEVLEEAVERVKVGVPLLDVALFVENKTREKGAEPAFPCNISVNEEASHATP
ncbi:MAG: M24 family metallopeptidase, partial [Methanophagales archaeon]|nr:M24 family metallopeptidase [Methanophagales archaeon]